MPTVEQVVVTFSASGLSVKSCPERHETKTAAPTEVSDELVTYEREIGRQVITTGINNNAQKLTNSGEQRKLLPAY